jgi:hypothetical protein
MNMATYPVTWDEISNDYPETVQIEWLLGNVCNYRCSYCVPELYSGTNRPPELNEALQFFNTLDQHYGSVPKQLHISGGEPTLWKDLIPFIEGLTDDIFLLITSNGSRTLNWWKRWKQVAQGKAALSLSFHPEYSSVDHFVELCNMLQDTVDVTVMNMLLPSYRHKYVELFERMAENDIKVHVRGKALRDWGNKQWSITYSDTDTTLLQMSYKPKKVQLDKPAPNNLVLDGRTVDKTEFNQIITNRQNTFKGWYCCIGSKRMSIRTDGTVTAAECLTGEKYEMGHISTGITYIPKGVICDTDVCGSAIEIKVPKHKHD